MMHTLIVYKCISSSHLELTNGDTNAIPNSSLNHASPVQRGGLPLSHDRYHGAGVEMRKRKLVELIPANFMGKRLTKGELQRISDRIDYLASMIDIWCPKLEHLNIDAAMEELDGWIEVLDHSTSQRSMGLNTYFHARNVRHTPVRAKLSIIDGGRWIGFPSRQSEAKLRVVS